MKYIIRLVWGVGLFLAGAVGGVAQTIPQWKGVGVLVEGQVEGDWVPKLSKPAEGVDWGDWELAEKSTRSAALRKNLRPTALMLPDAEGRSVLGVAPFAGLSGSVVDVGKGHGGYPVGIGAGYDVSVGGGRGREVQGFVLVGGACDGKSGGGAGGAGGVGPLRGDGVVWRGVLVGESALGDQEMPFPLL